MKQLELQLQKRLLIVEDVATGSLDSYYQDYRDKNPGKYLKFICKGSELTVEIARSIVGYKYASKNQSKMSSLNYLKSFISAIEANGYYWGENPLGEDPKKNKLLGTRIMNMIEYGKWQEAESHTFNPEKCIIFEIL